MTSEGVTEKIGVASVLPGHVLLVDGKPRTVTHEDSNLVYVTYYFADGGHATYVFGCTVEILKGVRHDCGEI